MKEILLLDVGGTSIKYGLAGPDGLRPETVRQRPSRADGTREEILDVFRSIAEEALAGTDVERVCVSIPGPFDFENGVSLMRHKFAALYGCSLKSLFEDRGLRSVFLHDSTAYILGESEAGSLAGVGDACCVMLGTGLGFAVMQDGRIWLNAEQEPALSLWCLPWGGGIAEDEVSTRAIQRRYGAGRPIREIAERARAGDAAAIRAFRETGAALAGMAERLVRVFRCDRFALGGQISLSADLFGLPDSIPWAVCAQPDRLPLIGVCAYALRGPESCVAIKSADEIRELEREVKPS